MLAANFCFKRTIIYSGSESSCLDSGVFLGFLDFLSFFANLPSFSAALSATSSAKLDLRLEEEEDEDEEEEEEDGTPICSSFLLFNSVITLAVILAISIHSWLDIILPVFPVNESIDLSILLTYPVSAVIFVATFSVAIAILRI